MNLQAKLALVIRDEIMFSTLIVQNKTSVKFFGRVPGYVPEDSIIFIITRKQYLDDDAIYFISPTTVGWTYYNSYNPIHEYVEIM